MKTLTKAAQGTTEPVGAAGAGPRVEPCRDAAQLRAYIDTHWRKDHVLARDPRMFEFQYATPWVDRDHFPGGISALCVYEGDRLLGFLGAITAPYPRPKSYWLALWHVLPELKGSGMGGMLLKRMQEIAEAANESSRPAGGGGGWIGTFGAGPEALPVYLKRGYCVRAVRRWVLSDANALRGQSAEQVNAAQPWASSAECAPPREWIDYRFAHHPIFEYEIIGGSVFRIECNAWGVVAHACRLVDDWHEAAIGVYERAAQRTAGVSMMMDAWSFDCPGPGWTLAAENLPSVFHPPAARGNLIYAVGRPFIPSTVQKGDCDQDRPN